MTRGFPTLGLLLLLGLPAVADARGSGYFSVTQTAAGHWDLLDPQGQRFYSTGVCVVLPSDTSIPQGGQGYGADRRSPGAIKEWAAWTTGRMQAWNFNTVGGWSHESMDSQGLAYTHSLALLGYAKPEDRLIDLWDPALEASMARLVQQGTSGRKDDPLLLGYFLDNELPWYGNTGWPGPQNTPLLDKYLALPAAAPGKAQAVAAVREHYHDQLNALPKLEGKTWKSWDALADTPLARDSVAWPEGLRQAFAGRVAERYFSVAVKLMKAADPHHLVLGCRFAGATPDTVVAAAKACDVVSVNSYQKSGRFDQDLFDRVYLLTGRPVMLTEFSFRSMANRSGNLNTKGADVTVATQQERVQKLDRFMAGALDLPYLVGYHWFQYFDEPTPGRSFDGEDSDYGLVDIHDQPYAELCAAFTRLNQDAAFRHRHAAHPIPVSLPTQAAIQVRQAVGAGAKGRGPGSLGDYGHDAGLAWVWKEASASAKTACEEGRLRLDYDSGKGWGCGLGLKTAGTNSDGSADLLGSSGVALTLRAPKGLRFQLFVSESGCGDPGAEAFKGVGGADGESYSSATFVGTGAAQRVEFKWDQAELRASWGNQHGNRTLDLQAVSGLDLALPGQQGAGALWVEKAELLP